MRNMLKFSQIFTTIDANIIKPITVYTGYHPEGNGDQIVFATIEGEYNDPEHFWEAFQDTTEPGKGKVWNFVAFDSEGAQKLQGDLADAIAAKEDEEG